MRVDSAARVEDGDSRERLRRQELELLLRIRRGDVGAAEAFWRRYEVRLVDIAARLGVPAEYRLDMVGEFVTDLFARLVRSEIVPQSLTAYVAASFCNFVASASRAEIRRAARNELAADEVQGSGERVVLECCSEYSLHATEPASADPAPATELHRELIAAVLESLSADDRVLLEYRARRLPLREAAEALGITHIAARVRLTRIRARAMGAARRFAAARGNDPEAVRLFQRLGL